LPDRSSVHDRAPSSGFIEPCLPTKVARPPSGPLWVHEIKHDGYRRVRCFTRDGHDWADRFPAIVDAALRIKAPLRLASYWSRSRAPEASGSLPRAHRLSVLAYCHVQL